MKTKLFLKHSFFAALWLFCAFVFLTNHVDDGNVWGIYLVDDRLLVGDFWSALLFIFMIKFTIDSIRDAWEVLP